MTPDGYRLPNGTIPVLLSADTRDLVRDEAAALLSYAIGHPEVAPGRVAEMLFRTRTARRHRALAMVADRSELVTALRAVVDDHEHPSVIRTATPATARRHAYVFPGQGGQRPGMGRLCYESVPAFRAETERCAQAFQTQLGISPLDYLLDEHLCADDAASTVQPALFTQMAGLAAMWRSWGVAPDITVGHSQGELAAAYVAGAITLADAVLVVGIRARAADEFGPGDYAMAVVGADRDTCEDVLARCSGWAQLSVVNSASMIGISGDRKTVRDIVDGFTGRGVFARVIRVRYPAHTSAMTGLGDTMCASAQRQLQNPRFLDTDIDCIGTTLGGPIPTDMPVGQYWFWNLRNIVRFDKAIAAAVQRDADTFVELSEHPMLQPAIQQNLAALTNGTDKPAALVVGTSDRTATDLDEFTRNLALLAVHDLNYSWESLRTETDGPAALPLIDFPNTSMARTRLWLPYVVDPVQHNGTAAAPAVAPAGEAAEASCPEVTPPRLLVEEWIRLSHRSLVSPRAVGVIDHIGASADLATAVCAAAQDLGATARVVGFRENGENLDSTVDLDTRVILLGQSSTLDERAAATEVATFFGDRTWWPRLSGTVTDCWLVTTGGEAVFAGDAPPDLVHAAASAGFRSVGAEHPGVRFRHLDLPAGLPTTESATAILSALHTADEPELAVRSGGLYAKRVVEGDPGVAAPDTGQPARPLEHVLIIGGTGQLGLEFCDHLARRGARRITLVSRSGGTAAASDRLARIRSAAPTQIVVTGCDVADRTAVARLAQQHHDIPADLIIHTAVDYSDIELNDITTEKVDQMLRAKVVGIRRVLDTCPRTDTCRVLLCSSVAATIGGRGQIVYAAANRMLDAMAYRLRAEGLDCVSVQWGQWTVHLDLDAAGSAKLAATGVVPMSPADALTLGMGRLHRNALVAAFDLARARPMLEAYGYGPLISQLASPVVTSHAGAVQMDLLQRLTRLLADAIGADGVDTIDTTTPLVAIGLDSLQALEFHRRVKKELNYDLAVSDLLGGASIADLLAQLAAR